jgi:hypothetical protein
MFAMRMFISSPIISFARSPLRKASFSQGAGQGDPAGTVARILSWDAPPPAPQELAEIWARTLDGHGVSRAALIASIPGDEASVAEAVARFPGRFHGYFMVNPLDRTRSSGWRAPSRPGFRGSAFFPPCIATR